MGRIPVGLIPLLILLACLIGSGDASAASSPPAPSCAEGPVRVGDTIVGTPCADTIVVPASVTSVNGGAGDDTIRAAAITTDCSAGCPLGVGSQTFEGGPGNDIVFGERGNDILRGGGGDDRLYGGIGDDLLEGGESNDLLAGGFGADGIDGGPGNDFVRGDGTQDEIVDAGTLPTDVDTLSYATAVTPGFGNRSGYPNFHAEHAGFPEFAAGRGVYLDLSASGGDNGDNGGAPSGGGVDTVAGQDFERIVGSPFSDYIVGSKPGQQILGGGGGDVLISGGSGTTLNGGADGDDCIGVATTVSCESTAANGSVSREEAKVAVGSMTEAIGEFAELYLVAASSGADEVVVESAGVAPSETVAFHLTGGSSFQAPIPGSGCSVQAGGTEVACQLAAPLDSVLVAGLGGNDKLFAVSLPTTTSLMLLGGDGNDELVGGDASDDTLVDGAGNDLLRGHAGDDALLNNEGRDELFGEGGNDLFLSTAICEGDLIDGGKDRDNSSWTKLKEGVEARLDTGRAGRPGGTEPDCTGVGASTDSLVEVDDLEGSAFADTFYGDGGENQLLGHLGADSYFGEGGNDSILANAGDDDAVINCGEGVDTALIDRRPKYNDPVPVECEAVREADPNNYRTVTELPSAVIEMPPPAPAPAPDTKPPRTKLGAHPAKVVTTTSARRRVAFRFTSSEPGSRFRCKLDAKPYRPCTSPRAYTVPLGRHAVRIFAIDAAGNADRTPVLYRFSVHRR